MSGELNHQQSTKVADSDESRLWTVNEVADYLQLSPQTIYRAVSEGRLPSIKVLSVLRFRPEEIMNWIEKQAKKRRRHPRVD